MQYIGSKVCDQCIIAIAFRQVTAETLNYIKDMPLKTHLKLEPLSDTECEKVLCDRFHVDAIPSKLSQAILKKAQGNPFFAEQLMENLRDRGVFK